nr:hypothetical protein Cry52Nrm1_p103 [Cryptomonas curvata]
MNTRLNFLLFLNRKLGQAVKIELSTKAKQDAVEYNGGEKIFITFSYTQNIIFHFNLNDYPSILISVSKQMFVSHKIQNYFYNHESIGAIIYVFNNIKSSKKILSIFKKENNKKMLIREISLFEKTIVYILDRKKKKIF